MKKDLIVIGKIVKTHGVRGGLTAFFYAEDYKTLKNYKKFYSISGQEIKIDFKSSPNYQITDDRSTSSIKLIIAVNDITDMNKAANFIDVEICISKDDIETKEEEFLMNDLINLNVYKYDKRDIKVGVIKDIHDFGGGVIVEIETAIKEFQSENMILFSDKTFPEINFAEKKIYLDYIPE